MNEATVKNNLKIIFMGTPEFAVASLEILLKNNYDIVAVITSPDKPAGRGQQVQQSAVKKYAHENNLKVLQPEKLKDEKFIGALKQLNADLQIVVAFRMLPEVIWKMPGLGTFNLHASLLPQYRGAAPINRAVINGETETGVTTFFLQQEIDTGKILFREKVKINENETAGELHDQLMAVGASLVLKTVQAIEAGNYTESEQSQFVSEKEILKDAPKIFKEDCRIDWNQNIKSIYNLILGLSPYPSARTEIVSPDGKFFILKIYKARFEISNHTYPVLTVLSDNKNYFKIALSEGFIGITELQLAGKKRMLTEEFLKGFKINDGWKVR